MRGVALAFLLGVALMLPTGGSAHTEGGGPHADGSVTLGPVGAADHYFEATLEDFGFAPAPRSVLRWSWAVEGGIGPAVYFDIHSHPPGGDIVRHYAKTSASDEGVWTLPGGDTYWLLWSNPTSVPLNLSYSIELLPPSENALLFSLVPVLGTGGAVAVIVLVLRRRKKEPESEPKDAEL